MSYEPNPRQREKEKPAPAGVQIGDPRFASLTAGLLARKGEAEPALEPFLHSRNEAGAGREMAPGARHEIDKPAAGEARQSAEIETAKSAPLRQAQVDPIDDASEIREEWQRVSPAPMVKPAPPAMLKREDAPRMAAPARPAPAAAPDKDFADNCPRQKIAVSAKRAAVTFRMSVHDFLRLKLASAELERSSQEIIIDAIEAWLDEKGVERLDNCRCLAEAARACDDKDAPD